jgi:hypothetical protein
VGVAAHRDFSLETGKDLTYPVPHLSSYEGAFALFSLSVFFNREDGEKKKSPSVS